MKNPYSFLYVISIIIYLQKNYLVIISIRTLAVQEAAAYLGQPLLAEAGPGLGHVEGSLPVVHVLGSRGSLQNKPRKEVKALLSHVNRISRPELLSMLLQRAPWAQDFAPSEAMPEGKVLQISAAGQNCSLGGIAVIGVTEVGAVLLIRTAPVVEVARQAGER